MIKLALHEPRGVVTPPPLLFQRVSVPRQCGGAAAVLAERGADAGGDNTAGTRMIISHRHRWFLSAVIADASRCWRQHKCKQPARLSSGHC